MMIIIDFALKRGNKMIIKKLLWTGNRKPSKYDISAITPFGYICIFLTQNEKELKKGNKYTLISFIKRNEPEGESFYFRTAYEAEKYAQIYWEALVYKCLIKDFPIKTCSLTMSF